MKAFVLLFLALCGSLYTLAQVMDSLDNLILKIPAGWEVQKHETYTQLTKINKAQNSFCQVAIYQQQPASTDLNASYKSEWEGLMLAYFETDATPAPKLRKTKQGNVLSYGAQVKHKANGLPYYSELHVYDCGNYVQSVLVTTGAKKHLYDSIWQPLIVGVRKNSASSTTVSTTNNTNTGASNPFSGKWSKSGSSPVGLDPGTVLTNAGYYKCTYDFRPDGSYALRGESRTNTGTYIAVDETGSYKLNGTQLTITPAKGKLQSLNSDGKVLKSQSVDLAKRIYSWQLYYFEGLNETQLVLTPAKPYAWDGGTGGSSQFPNSVLLSQQYKPEWRFK